MAENSRTQKTREAKDIHPDREINWGNSSTLDTENIPAKDGFTQRWVRTKVKGEDDQDNVFRKINEGWKPRMLSSVAKGQFVPNIDFQGSDVIGIHGMILMERPLEVHKSQGQYVKSMTDMQMQGVKDNMFNAHSEGSGMTRPTMRSSSSVSRGKRPEFADD